MPLFGQPDFDPPKPPPDYDPEDFNFSALGMVNEKYIWNTWGDNCVICSGLRGQVHTLDFWMNAGIWPGFHPNCDCSMKRVPADTPESDPDIFGTAIPIFARMFLPRPNIFYDPEFSIQPWQMSIIDDLEKLHLALGPDTPFHVLFDKLKGSGLFSLRTTFYGDTAGWRVLATSRYFQNIDGDFSGSDLFTFKHIRSILEPLWKWFESRWKTSSKYIPNKKYSLMRREDIPLMPLKPMPLLPWLPFQTNYTELLK